MNWLNLKVDMVARPLLGPLLRRGVRQQQFAAVNVNPALQIVKDCHVVKRILLSWIPNAGSNSFFAHAAPPERLAAVDRPRRIRFVAQRTSGWVHRFVRQPVSAAGCTSRAFFSAHIRWYRNRWRSRRRHIHTIWGPSRTAKYERQSCTNVRADLLRQGIAASPIGEQYFCSGAQKTAPAEKWRLDVYKFPLSGLLISRL